MNMYMLINIASDILTFHGGTCDDLSLKNRLLWNHSSSWGPIIVGKQNFVGSCGRYFAGKLR